MGLPWKVTADDLNDLNKYYPGQEINGLATIRAFYFSGFEVPALAIFAFYILLVSLVAVNAVKKCTKILAPGFYAVKRAQLRLVRAHLMDVAAFGRTHSKPIYLFGRRSLPVRLPLRFQFLVITALVLFNVVVLVTFYDITSGDVNVYWPGPDSHHQQQVRYLADRSCVLAMGQLPIVFLTAGRYSPLALLSGIDFADAMLYHRWLARMVWAQASVHSFAYTYLEASNGYLAESFKQAYWNWGVAAVAMFWGITIFAYGQLRTRAYEVFVALHVIMGIMALVGVYFHIHLLAYWRYKVYIVLTEISAAVWALDRLARAVNRVYTSARIRQNGMLASATLSLRGEDLVRLRITLPLSRLQLPGEQSGVRSLATRIAPGHSVRILIPRVQVFSDHPFTVIGTGTREEGGKDLGYLDLLIRQQRGFTKQLSKLAPTAADDIDTESGHIIKHSSVLVEGPYGALHYNELREASEVLLFAGGVGVAYTLPYFIESALSSSGTPCTMVWMIRDLAIFDAVAAQLKTTVAELTARFAQADQKLQQAPLRIHLHLTSGCGVQEQPDTVIPELDKHLQGNDGRTDTGGPETDGKSESSDAPAGLPAHAQGLYADFEPYFHVSVSYGRADPSIGHPVQTPTQKDHKPGRLVVMSCGPASLCDDVRYEAQRALASGLWADVCYFEECFNW